ncbi:hypothetical protein Gohar_005736 [Gossypium harknessii]|uniref:Uncharacterized protein n=1 Tax=Gossypium harknessii TaxID=34285 RepID=A0A7J9H9I0_9ROSI|nr:hypothetical protein [Gossypium harknessii]
MGTTDELTSCMAYCWACLSSSSVHVLPVGFL